MRRNVASKVHTRPDSGQERTQLIVREEKSPRRIHRRRQKVGRAVKFSDIQVMVCGTAFMSFVGLLIIAAVKYIGVGYDGSFREQPTSFNRTTPNVPSCDPLTVKDIQFTLVLQCSRDRLWMMKHHCKRWGFSRPISMAVLTNETKEGTLDRLGDLGCSSTQISLSVMPQSERYRLDYPVNRLRNLALQSVKTSHVIVLDIDFWESTTIGSLLFEPAVLELLAQDPKLAIVLPAFQLSRQCPEYRECPEYNIPEMPNTKDDLVQLVREKRAAVFDPTNLGGHGSTLYYEWGMQEPGELLTIPCVTSNRYEPYFAVRYCNSLPPYQEQFTGYGKNKMTMVMHMRHVGYRFAQLGGAFVIHYPHLDSASRMLWNEGPEEVRPHIRNGKYHQTKPKELSNVDWNKYKRGQVDAIFVSFRNWLQSEILDQSRVPKCEDSTDDDSKLWVNRSVLDVGGGHSR